MQNINFTKAIILKILNLFLFVVITILFAILDQRVSIFQSIFFVTLFASLILLPWAFITKFKHLKIATERDFYLYTIRGIFNVLGITSWVFAIKLSGINEATALSYMIPIFTTIFGILFLGEKLNIKCLIAVLVSLVGSYMIILPQFKNVAHNDYSNLYGILIALFSCIMWAGYDTVCKKQSKNIHFISQAFYNFLLSAIFIAPFIHFDINSISSSYLLHISSISIFSIINVIVLFLAYKNAPIYVLMPFSYLRLLMMSVASYLIFNIAPANHLLVGASIISLSSLYIFYVQKVKRLYS